MIKRFALAALIAFLPLLAMAQDVKLGYINTQEVLMMMPEVDALEKQMMDFNEKNTKYLQDMQNEIQNKANKYEEEKATLTDAIRRVKEEELQSLYERFQTAQQTLYQESQAQQAKLLQPLQEKLKNAIETVSKRQSLMFVYDMASGAVVYKSDKAIDITSAVKKELGIL